MILWFYIFVVTSVARGHQRNLQRMPELAYYPCCCRANILKVLKVIFDSIVGRI